MTGDLRALRSLMARRWSVIVPAVVLVPILTLVLAVGQHKVYSANAQVLLTYSNIGATLNGLPANYASLAPIRNVDTQAELARSQAVAHEALVLSGVRGSATDFLNKSSVSSSATADLLTFSVTDAPPSRAMTLATNYAQAYTLYRGQIDGQAVTTALAGINRQLAALVAAGQAASPAVRLLGHEQEQLVGMQAAGTNDAVVVQPAQSATQIGPHPARSAALGLGVGIVLAVALVFLMETVDKRVTVEEIERRLRLPNLATIPAVSDWRRSAVLALQRAAALVSRLAARVVEQVERERGDGPARLARHPPSASNSKVATLAVVRDPYGRTAEAFGVLKSSLEFAGLEHDFKSLLLTSARRYRGKSDVAANLAVTLAQAGRRVLLCDLDPRRASVTELFGLGDRPGVTEVAQGSCLLEDSIVSVTGLGGDLKVLPFGALPPHSGFLGTRAVADLVESLRYARADLVLIDAPPLLASGEAQTLSALADALVVALADPVRPAVVADLAVTLSRLPARPLGFITVGVAREAGEGVGGRDAADRELTELTSPSNGRGRRPAAGVPYSAVRRPGVPD